MASKKQIHYDTYSTVELSHYFLFNQLHCIVYSLKRKKKKQIR